MVKSAWCRTCRNSEISNGSQNQTVLSKHTLKLLWTNVSSRSRTRHFLPVCSGRTAGNRNFLSSCGVSEIDETELCVGASSCEGAARAMLLSDGGGGGGRSILTSPVELDGFPCEAPSP